MPRLFSGHPKSPIDLTNLDQQRREDDGQRALVENAGGVYVSPLDDVSDSAARAHLAKVRERERKN
jgi:hypothetical protein